MVAVHVGPECSARPSSLQHLQPPRCPRPSRANYGEDGSFGVNFPPLQLLAGAKPKPEQSLAVKSNTAPTLSGGRTGLRSIRLLMYRSSLRSNSTTRIQAEARTVLG